jgi:hypothetical protein
MSSGLRIWDASGNMTLEITDRLSRYIGLSPYFFPANVSSVFVNVAGAEPSSWFAFSYDAINPRCITSSNGFTLYRVGHVGSSASGNIAVFRY